MQNLKLNFKIKNISRMSERHQDKKKKETILDLGKYLDKKIRVKFSGGREVSGVLKGKLVNFFLFD